jgi:hypothetical protein
LNQLAKTPNQSTEFGRPIVTTSRRIGITFDEEVRQTRIKHQDALAHAIERRTREYQEQGLADDQINAWFAANALGGMVAFVSDQIVSRDVPVDIDFVVEQLTRLWANAIRLNSE